MRALAELKAPSQVDPQHLQRIFFFDHLCLIAAGFIALINLVPSVMNPLRNAAPTSWLDMRTSCIVMTLCTAISLYFAEATQPRLARWFGMFFGALTSAIAILSYLSTVAGPPLRPGWSLNRQQIFLGHGSMQLPSIAFFLMGITILFASSKPRWVGHIADGTAFILSFLVFTLLLGHIFRLAGLSSSSTAGFISVPTLWCIAQLTLAVIFRRAEGSVLSLVWGYGTGSRVARILGPILVLLPMLREIARAHLLRSGWFPPQYAAAFLTSVGTFLGLILLFVLVRIINRMQERIQNDVLKDELTGLYSLKGFYLLAEQAFRHSRRDREPFCVLFVDMDNLKKINDKLGHSMGSVSLVETAKLLTTNFRDTDIIGRVGGDEFIVAGQFNNQDIAAAVDRLREAVTRKNEAVEQQFSISLSMGYAVAQDIAHETLQNLVSQADEAMYEEKRSKKEMRTAVVQAGSSSLESPHNNGAAFSRVGL